MLMLIPHNLCGLEFLHSITFHSKVSHPKGEFLVFFPEIQFSTGVELSDAEYKKQRWRRNDKNEEN